MDFGSYSAGFASSMIDQDVDYMERELMVDEYESGNGIFGYLYEEVPIATEKRKGPNHLNNFDYTLNSPMISDDLEDYIQYYINKDQTKSIYHRTNWKYRSMWLRKLPHNLSTVKGPKDYHNFVAQTFLRSNINLSQITKLIEQSDDDARKTFDVVKAYFKTWLNKECIFISRKKNPHETLKYGAIMLDLYIVILIMNAATTKELDSLKQSFKLVYTERDDEDDVMPTDQSPKTGVLYQSPVFGEVHIGYGVAYFASHHLLMDRSMILMIKDTATARFHTLFNIQHKYQSSYSTDHMSDIIMLYHLGDKMLQKDSKRAYDCIGLVEPLTSYKLSLLAAEARPLIPKFTKFPEHLKRKQAELSENFPESLAFFNKLFSLSNKYTLLTAYGSFRHWGHPYIDYFTGLEALHKNVTSNAYTINVNYANQLASDLTYKILYTQFHKKKKWFVDAKLLPKDHVLYDYVIKNIWPTADVTKAIPNGWNRLPLIKCWDVPEVVSPALIYSDKTHSMNRKEVLDHIQMHPSKPIPTRKVLETFIQQGATDWPTFLKEIDKNGLPDDDLIIGLKAKEREIKSKGRFFALMSWKLREYFVFTEYLIKKEVIPLFRGLTMADDQTTLLKKMIENTAGQGEKTYKKITIANHIDYQKWNNFQREESNGPVFKVMGQFFGFPNLFSRTHEFFKKSIIYYRDRPDLMVVKDGKLESKYPDKRVCWDGQAGGLEGLRQKGWSVLNLLVIERESRFRNTEVKILAQGDNQVICTMFEVNPWETTSELKANLEAIMLNNDAIMSQIRNQTLSIGLLINDDETLQSADMLIYGKIIVYRGNLTCLEEKRLSRVTCTTNDQLPSLGNILATVSTNCLTVSHYSKSSISSIYNYNWLGNLVINILEKHNPALRSKYDAHLDKEKLKTTTSTEFRIGLLYLDPSLGGISGMSLTRFMMRMFPDPVTEGLTFWKMVYNGTNSQKLRMLAINFGNPRIAAYGSHHFCKLLEDPASLNLPRAISATNLLKEEIRNILKDRPSDIKNVIVREAVAYNKAHSDSFIDFLASIQPCFPRFLSEFKAATYLGITDSIIGLFENSKTIRNMLRPRMRDVVDEVIVKCELGGILTIIDSMKTRVGSMWTCSSAHADELRKQSWRRKIIGTTVPHPAEMIGKAPTTVIGCDPCQSNLKKNIFVNVLVPLGMHCPEDERGPYAPYLGSSTSENTSLIQTWEKDTDISFLRRASELRKVFHWFVSPNGHLGNTILNNLKSLTGEDPGKPDLGFKRTGSALHRFSSSRVSAGGYLANSPVYGTRMLISTDQFQNLGSTNYDFMFQSLMLYSQQTVGEIHEESPTPSSYHLHIACLDCLRPIDEPNLESFTEFVFPDVSEHLKSWKPSDTQWFKMRVSVPLLTGDWESVPFESRCYSIGLVQGLIYGELCYEEGKGSLILDQLFPIGLRDYMHGTYYLSGMKEGLCRAAGLAALAKRAFYQSDLEYVVKGCYYPLVEKICGFPPFITFCQGKYIEFAIHRMKHRIPPSYPSNMKDLGASIRNVLEDMNYKTWIMRYNKKEIEWIFADFTSAKLAGIIILGRQMLELLIKNPTVDDRPFTVKKFSDLLSAIKSDEMSKEIIGQLDTKYFRICNSEVRHAIKESHPVVQPLLEGSNIMKFRNKSLGGVRAHEVRFINQDQDIPQMEVPKIKNPLISGMRIAQLATGSFYKMDAILTYLDLKPMDILCGGDGSGGISSLLLRRNEHSRLIFNSIMELNDVGLSGTLPKPPSALQHMDDLLKERCVNLTDAWDYSSNLADQRTWDDFKYLRNKHGLQISLMVFDMEVRDEKMSDDIETNLFQNVDGLIRNTGTVIYKTYVHRLLKPQNLLSRLGQIFSKVELIQTDWSSSHTSEVYICCQGKKPNDTVRSYVDYNELLPFLKRCYCFRNDEEEFNRAVSLLKYDTKEGIPDVLIPIPSLELMNIWRSLKMELTAAEEWKELFVTNILSDPITTALLTCALISNYTIPTTRWYRRDKNIPSDHLLKEFFAYYIGTWSYVALLSKDSAMYGRILQFINKPFFISFHFKKVPQKGRELVFHMAPDGNKGCISSEPVVQHRMSWKITNTRQICSKEINLKSHLSAIGSVIRYHLSSQKTNCTSQLVKGRLLKAMEGINQGLTLKNILLDTDVFYFS